MHASQVLPEWNDNIDILNGFATDCDNNYPHGFDWNNDGIGCEIGGEPEGGLLPQVTVQCGQVVQGIVTLTTNLNCSGDGLIVADDGTTINLNGFGIYGPGTDSSKIGIGVSENNIIIRGPGIISGFQAAEPNLDQMRLYMKTLNARYGIFIHSQSEDPSLWKGITTENNNQRIIWTSVTPAFRGLSSIQNFERTISLVKEQLST